MITFGSLLEIHAEVFVLIGEHTCSLEFSLLKERGIREGKMGGGEKGKERKRRGRGQKNERKWPKDSGC